MLPAADRTAAGGSIKTILIAGATGFLGSTVARRSLARGHRVLALVRDPLSPGRLADVKDAVEWFGWTDGIDAAFAAPRTPDAVVYAAASFARGVEPPSSVCEANTLLPLRVLERSLHASVPLFLNADTALHNVLNPYSLSKHQFAEWGRLLAADRGLRFVNVRLEHLYGPGDDESKFPAFVVASLLRNEPELRLTQGEQQRDFVFIDDVGDAYDVLLDADARLASGYHEISVGSGRPVRVRDFVETVRDMTGSTTVLRFGALPYRPHEVMRSAAELDAIHALGWTPRTSLDDGLKATIAAERERCAS